MPDNGAHTESVAPVNVAGRAIGPGRKTLIVAEAGVNHDGELEKALLLVDAAARAGADAVKFQVFRAETLVSEGAETAPYQRLGCGAASQRAMLTKLELPVEAFRRIRDHCAERSILFLATPFSPSDIEVLIELNVPAVKIASTDLGNVALLDAASTTGLPLIVSTGASTREEIIASVNRLLQSTGRDRVIVLHCVSCYPTPLEAANLRAIRRLELDFHVPCGLSDHTTSIETGGWAVAAGACVLEKHLTLDRQAVGPDHTTSLDPEGFAEYVSRVRQAEAALGSGTLGMTEREEPVRRVARKSVVTTRAVAAGTVLTAEMLTLKRPGTGIDPSELGRLEGCRISRDIPADTILTWDMVS